MSNNSNTSKPFFNGAEPVFRAVIKALRYLVDVEGGATTEQLKVLRTLGVYILKIKPSELEDQSVIMPNELKHWLPDEKDKRCFLQLAIMLELCRHPRSKAQLSRFEEFAEALDFHGVELHIVQELCHRTAEEATADFIHIYSASMPELSERHGAIMTKEGTLKYSEDFFERVSLLHTNPYGSLGWCFSEFYKRNDLILPNCNTPNPGYYVCHDMNHVITGYEPTGPGEIALGAFKLALCPSEANWLASLTNFLIHEVGLFKHGTDLQFIPYGGDGEPYHGLNGKRGALDLPGAPELLAEALNRGKACSGDFSALDHLAIADVPLIDIRKQFNVIPLKHPMFSEDNFWPQ